MKSGYNGVGQWIVYSKPEVAEINFHKMKGIPNKIESIKSIVNGLYFVAVYIDQRFGDVDESVAYILNFSLEKYKNILFHYNAIEKEDGELYFINENDAKKAIEYLNDYFIMAKLYDRERPFSWSIIYNPISNENVSNNQSKNIPTNLTKEDEIKVGKYLSFMIERF